MSVMKRQIARVVLRVEAVIYRSPCSVWNLQCFDTVSWASGRASCL